jgi:hypothetical protein
MPNSTAVLTRKLTDTSLPSPPAVTVSVPYQAAQPGGRIDVPATTAADTVYPVAFGSCAEATYCEIYNSSTAQDVAARMGGASVSGVLVLGTVTLALAAAPGERLAVELGDDNGGTIGDDIAVRRSAGNVIVTSYNSSGPETLDVSNVTVYNNAPPILTPGGVLTLSNPAAGSTVSSAEAVLTDVQVAAGIISTIVLGDPV